MGLDILGLLLDHQQARDRGVTVAPATVSYDTDFLAGLISVGAFEFDANSSGEATGQRGGVIPDWQPCPGLEEIPCRIVWKSIKPINGQALPSQARFGRLLLGQAVVADRRYRVRYTDGDFGTVYAYLLGPVRNAHQMNHHWVADVQDRPL